MATVTAGNSTTITVSGDQTVAVSVTHNNSGRITFTPAGNIQGVGGTGHQFGPLPTSATYGPWGVAGTLVIYADLGTVTYTVNDSYFPNKVGIGTATPGDSLDVTNGNIWLTQAYALKWQNAGTMRGAVLADSGNNILFQNGSALGEKVRIDSNGYLGIGTGATINAALHVTSANTGKPAATFYVNDAGTAVQNLVGFSVYNNVSNGLADTTLVYGNTVNSFLAFGHHNGTTYSERFRIDSSGNFYSSTFSGTALATGFIYIPGAAGTPTGTPTSVTGQFPMFYDSTNNKFYVYNAGWKGVVLA